MSLQLYQRIALSRDVPQEGLRRGDVAYLLDFVSHPNDGEQGCILEIFNAVGDSINVVTVPISAVQSLGSDQVLTVRTFASLSST